MAEASIAAYGAILGVAIVFALVCFALVCFALRGKDHSDNSHNHDYDKVTTDDEHVHQN